MYVKTCSKGFICVVLFCSFCLVGTSSGDAAFLCVKLEVDPAERVLEVGDTATLQVWGWAQGAVSPNGLVGWELGLDVDTDGIVAVEVIGAQPQVTYYDIVAGKVHYPITDAVNQANAGEISLSNTAMFVTASDAAVDDYVRLADVTIEALALGTVQYSVGLASTNLFQGLLPGEPPLDISGIHEVGEWDGSIMVTPEPISIALLLFGSVIAVKRRHR